MSAPDPRPPTNWSRSLAKITALNRFARTEDAGIRPGEDAHELTARRLHSAAKRTSSPNATHSSPGGIPDRLKRLQRGLDSQPPRKWSTSSDYSNASYGSSGSGGSSSSSMGPLPRRTSDHRVLPYRLNDLGRMSNLHRTHMVVLDTPESELPSCSLFSNYWNENPQICPLSDKDRASITVESVISSSLASDAGTAMTGYTLPDPLTDTTGPDRPYFHSYCRPQYFELNARPVITASPPFSPGLRSLDPFDTLPSSSSPHHSPKTPARLQEMSADIPHEESPPSDVNYQTSPYEHGKMADSNTTIQHQPEPGSSGSSNNDPATPTSDHDNSDDAPSDFDESEAPSEDSQATLQRDFLEEILHPVKRQLVERLMVYVANMPNLRVPMLPMRPRNPHPLLKADVATPTFDRANLKPFSRSEPTEIDTETPDDWNEDIKTVITSQPDSNDLQDNPGTTSQQSTVSRGYGKRAVRTTANHTNHFESNGGQKRKAGANSSPNGNEDGDGDDNDDDDDDDEHSRGHKLRRSQSLSAPKRRIACPYFQRNSLKPPKADSCFRNGFKDIAKMKEHLERVHDHSIQCPRCFAVFKEPHDLNTHLRLPSDALCIQAAERSPTDAYNATQATMLKERMKNQSLERKWKAIWHILFPADADDAIKPPWWTPHTHNIPEDAVARFFAQYEDFTRADLPQRITSRIVALVDVLLADHYLGGLVNGIVNACLEESFAAFKAGESSPGDEAVAGPSSTSSDFAAVPGFAGHATADGAELLGAQQQRELAALQQHLESTVYGNGEPVLPSVSGLSVAPVPITDNVSGLPTRGEVDGYGQDVGAGFLGVRYSAETTQTPSGLTPKGGWEHLTMLGELYADDGLSYGTMDMEDGGAQRG